MTPETRCHDLTMRIYPSRQTELHKLQIWGPYVSQERHMSVTLHLYNWREHKYVSHNNNMYKYTKIDYMLR